ncbi:hypothetical protein KP509_18G067600 [Ceratopteris richardii]|uniref:Uncharacterized protein n=1 Tax=Ceratopteris richardii TaxID=49495 RepID=A0A8T2SS41_CERRI|nr:hypothetical protein KP509_18G067600 [Ceratopteris richardii]
MIASASLLAPCIMSPLCRKERGGRSKNLAPRSALGVDFPDSLHLIKHLSLRDLWGITLKSINQGNLYLSKTGLRLYRTKVVRVWVEVRLGLPQSEEVNFRHQNTVGFLKAKYVDNLKGSTMKISKTIGTDKAHTSSATRTRVSFVENFESLIASSRRVPERSDVSSGS